MIPTERNDPVQIFFPQEQPQQAIETQGIPCAGLQILLQRPEEILIFRHRSIAQTLPLLITDANAFPIGGWIQKLIEGIAKFRAKEVATRENAKPAARKKR